VKVKGLKPLSCQIFSAASGLVILTKMVASRREFPKFYRLQVNNNGNSGRQILVVDDEPSVCRAIKMLLEVDGHEVSIAAGGYEALDIFDKSSFDLVLTDYSMPDMKGDEFAAIISSAVPPSGSS